MGNGARIAAVLAAIAAAVVLFIVLNGGDDSSSSSSGTTSTTTSATSGGGGNGGAGQQEEVPTIEITGGEPVGGVQDLDFTSGDDIRFDVKSDEAWEIHFHGYDLEMDVEAGGMVSFDVPADIEGVFEVEIEDTAAEIANVTVEP